MNRNILIGAAAIAAVLLLSKKSHASEESPPYSGNDNENDYFGWGGDDDVWQVLEPTAVVDMNNFSQNLRAFLYMIQRAEHSAGDVSSGAAYNIVFGGDRFNDMSDHPAITGEWRGRLLSDSMCRNAGYGPGCISTAAGAYQIRRKTWEGVRKAGKWGGALPDFGPASQDEAGRRLIVQRGALALVEAGRVEDAIKRVAQEWASLPGNNAKQSQRSLPEVLAFYDDGLRSG